MNWLCWLIDHKWTTRYPVPAIVCQRCGVEPYDDTSMPEWFRNTRIVPRLRRFAKRVRVWWKSRPCWIKDHQWSPTSMHCLGCGQSGVEISENGEWTYPVWRSLWKDYLRDRFYVVKPYLQEQTIYCVNALAWRFGVEKSTIYIAGERYMTRYLLYLGPINFRLHQFFRGDDDSASHTHPWWFITFPFSTYAERRFHEGVEEKGLHYVKAFRFHYRPSDHEHIVVGKVRGQWTADYTRDYFDWVPDPRKFWTFVITGTKSNDWGFYPEPGKFVYWRDYKPGVRTGAKP